MLEFCKEEERSMDGSSFGYPVSIPMLGDRTCEISVEFDGERKEGEKRRMDRSVVTRMRCDVQLRDLASVHRD